MKYSKGVKYYTREDEQLESSCKPPEDIVTEWIILTKDGGLYIMKGYAWDGPSGPTIDTDNSMTPSLGHDALAQLMRMDLLDQKWRIPSNEDFHRWLRERKMSRFRAGLWKRELDKFGGPSTDPKNKRKIYEVE